MFQLAPSVKFRSRSGFLLEDRSFLEGIYRPIVGGLDNFRDNWNIIRRVAMARESRYYGQSHILRRLTFKAVDEDAYKQNAERLSFKYRTENLPHYYNFAAKPKRLHKPLHVVRGRRLKPKETAAYAEDYLDLDLERGRRFLKTKEAGSGLKRLYRYFDVYTPWRDRAILGGGW